MAKLSQTRKQTLALPGDFRRTTTLAIAVVGSLVLLPFWINNLWQGRWLLGLGSLFLSGLLAFIAVTPSARSQGRRAATLLFAGSVLIYLVFSIREQGAIGVLWCFPAVITFCVMLSEKQARVMTLLLALAVAPVAYVALGPPLWIRFMVSLLTVIAFTTFFVNLIERQRRVLEQLVQTDPLSGLMNRSQLRQQVERRVAACRAEDRAVSVLMIDIDHFKSINDRYGHAVGDEVIAGVAGVIQAHIREGDVGFRVGGEEFLVLLGGCGLQAARERAEHIREAVERWTGPEDSRVTVSAGVAEIEPQQSVRDWLKRSDDLLYAAKAAGRNRVAS